MSYDYPSLREHFVNGTRRGDPRWNDSLTHNELLALWLVKEDDERCAAIDVRLQELKNASLGFRPDQVAQTLRLQVNMGIGGLLLMQQRLQAATIAVLVSKGVCTAEEFNAALQTAVGEPVNTIIAARLTYWNWVVQADAHAAALKLNPNLAENFPPPPSI